MIQATAIRNALGTLTLTAFIWGMCCALAIPSSALAQRLEGQAIPGQPFGVGVVTFPSQGDAAPPFTVPALEEQDGRVFYPAFSSGGLLRSIVSNGNSGGPAGPITALFLFTGDEPLHLTLHGSQSTAVTLRPEAQSPRVQSRLLQRWWREFNSTASDLSRSGDFPPLVQIYLTEMLGQRLGLRPPILSRIAQGIPNDELEVFKLLLGTEGLHEAKLRESMSRPRDPGPADEPLHEEVSWQSPDLPPMSDVDIEPIAKQVPEECFYIRFGNFENYLWLEDLLTSYGGDIGRMVAARGQDAKAGDRLRRQLSLPQTVLSKIFGSQLISDVALVGRDLYLQDGAAIGVLFQARNGTLLGVSIRQQRNQILASERDAGVTLENVKIAGQDVSFLSTPDNQIRSYYAIKGDYHLVSTSRDVIERFLVLKNGQGSLASSPEFRRARAAMPLTRDDTIFLFLSSRFLGGLFTPEYQIELNRRLHALVDLELVRLAQLAAATEKQPAATVDDLIAGGFLPSGFGRQPDGSGPILEADRVIDSLRGARGSFLPIPDADVTHASARENEQFLALAQAQLLRWQSLDPISVAIRRETLPGNRERMNLEANIPIFAEAKYGKYLSMLGPPVTQKVLPRPGDVISVQAAVTGGQYSAVVPPHLLFVGVKDQPLPNINPADAGLFQWIRLLRSVPGYIGAWPKPGFVDWLPLRNNQVTPDGFSRLPFDVWRWQGDGFSLLSFQRPILEDVVPQLAFAESDDPAQLRLHVADLSESQLSDGVNALYYQRAWQTSGANVLLLQSLTQQLRVPPDQALSTAESLLDTHLVCPLGGKYEFIQAPNGRVQWQSTAWLNGNADGVPVDYRSPLLQWFRGLDLSLTKSENQISIRSTIELQR